MQYELRTLVCNNARDKIVFYAVFYEDMLQDEGERKSETVQDLFAAVHVDWLNAVTFLILLARNKNNFSIISKIV